MKLRKYITIALLTALPFTLTACGSTADPKPTSSATASPTASIDERETVAKVTEDFFNHFLTLSDADRQKLVDSIPAAAFDMNTNGELTVSDTKAKAYVQTLRETDPELTVIDTGDYDAQRVLLLYASFISLSGYIDNANVTVDATQVVISGNTATVPGSALIYTVDGETQTPAADGGTSGTLRKVNGRWLISPSISG